MLYHNCTAFTGMNTGCIHIAPVLLMDEWLKKRILCCKLFCLFFHLEIFTRHGYEVIHFIAPVDIH